MMRHGQEEPVPGVPPSEFDGLIQSFDRRLKVLGPIVSHSQSIDSVNIRLPLRRTRRE